MTERSLTIHHVAPHFYPDIGGLEDSVHRLGSWFANLGHHVVVHTSVLSASGESLPVQDSIDGIEIRRYTPVVHRGYFRTWFRPDLADADLIHLHGYAVRTNDRVVRSRSKAPTVFSLHHGVRMVHTARSTRILRRAYDRVTGLPTLRRVNRIIVASKGDLEWLANHGIPTEKVRVIPTPLPDTAFVPGDPSWAVTHVPTPRFVLFLGRIHAEKGVDVLLETVPQLPRDVSVVYAGPDGGWVSRLQQRARELGVANRVLLVGSVSEDQKRSLLATCAVLALPSLFEAQGLAAIEAWAQGRPIIGSRVGALAELVREGDTGYLVPYGDPSALTNALHKALDDPDAVAEMGRRARQAAEPFRASRLLPEVERIYAALT